MDYDINFARSDEEAELRGIFLDSEMDLAGELEEHVVIKARDEVIGGGLMTRTGIDTYHLTVFAVRESARGNGIGSTLIRELIRQPWKHSLNRTKAVGACFTVTTMAKGKSSGFYQKNGFAPCSPSELADPYRGQCSDCPERESCNPVPMRYLGLLSEASGA